MEKNRYISCSFIETYFLTKERMFQTFLFHDIHIQITVAFEQKTSCCKFLK